MRKIFFITFIIITLFSCSKESDKPQNSYTLSPHYISIYVVPSDIKVIPANDIFYIEFNGTIYPTYKGEDYMYNDIVKSLSDLYGDTYYKRTVKPMVSSHPALAYPIDEISIYCDKNFDTEHPAGEPLNDIAKMNYKSYYNFIKNGYLPYTQNHPNEQDVDSFSFCFEDINAEMTKLISLKYKFTSIEFASQPETPGEYTFTLEMTINGKVYKSEFSYTFE